MNFEEIKPLILLTGAKGFVGSRALQQLSAQYEVLPLPSGVIRQADRDTILRTVETLIPRKPVGIIHTAAISAIDICEKDPEASRLANVTLPLALGEAAARFGLKLVSFSSDQVYSGETELGPFTEDREVHPANTYGRHKLEAEQRLMDVDPDAVSLRATWMYDLPGYGLPIRGNMLINLIRAALTNGETVIGAQDWRGITYVRQAVSNLTAALSAPGGVYNYGSPAAVPAPGIAEAFVKALQLPVTVRADDSRPARSLLMDQQKAVKAGIVFDDSCAGILQCIRDYGLDRQ